jgi:RNA polymerase sigma-70 factor (ECF subfamily)
MKTGKSHTDIHQGLIDLCRTQDRSAQIKIYELYYKAMYNTSFRIVNNTMEAEDIMQESFLDAFRKLDSFKGDSSFGSWLKRIVVNKSLDSIKKKKLFIAESKEDQLSTENEENEDREFVFTKVEEVKKALETLPDQYRIILSLYLLEGYDHQEISEILDISCNNVRTRYTRAKHRLVEEVNSSKKKMMNALKN